MFNFWVTTFHHYYLYSSSTLYIKFDKFDIRWASSFLFKWAWPINPSRPNSRQQLKHGPESLQSAVMLTETCSFGKWSAFSVPAVGWADGRNGGRILSSSSSSDYQKTWYFYNESPGACNSSIVAQSSSRSHGAPGGGIHLSRSDKIYTAFYAAMMHGGRTVNACWNNKTADTITFCFASR